MLQEEIRKLKGSAGLCQLILNQGCLEVTGDQLDHYLTYICQEEEKGVRFAEVEEFLDDITEYTREEVFCWSPAQVWLYKQSRVSAALSLLFWGFIRMVPIGHVIGVCLKQTALSIPLLLMYGSIIVIYSYGFKEYRKKKYLEHGC